MSSQNIEEMPAADIPTQEGYIGNLTEDQHSSLVRMWESYFDICDRARGNASKGQGFTEDKTGGDLKKSGIPDDDKAKDEAKRLQEQQGMNALMEEYGPEALRDSWWNFVRGDNPDGNMLRFIRARKGDVERGLAMMATCLKWRLDTDVESFILKGDLVNSEEIPKFIEQQKSGKVFSLGCTVKEQPICYVIMAKHSVFGQPAASMQKFIVTQMETFRLLMHPPNDKATIFFDLKGFGVKQMDFVSLLYLVKVLESYYPESLGTMYVSNAPWIFWGFWRAVKNLLDPVVRNKIKFIAKPEDTEGDVPEDMMIEYCGGKVKTDFQFVDPRKGENDPQQDKETKEKLLKRHRALTDKYEEVTRAWCKAGGKDEQLQEQRDVLVKKLRLSQFELEPYTRGLTAYHRNGVLPPENAGISVFDYEQKDGPTRRQVLGRKSCRKSIEQQLYAITKERKTVKEAEQQTLSALKDGSWGQWRVNDNSEEVKKTALASLTDLDNTGKVDLDSIDNPNGTQEIAAKQSPDNIVKQHREAAGITGGLAAAAGVAAGGAATAKATSSSKEVPQPTSNGHHVPEEKSSDATPQQTSSQSQVNGTSNGNHVQEEEAAVPKQNGTLSQQNGKVNGTTNHDNQPTLDGGNNAPRPRGQSASQGPQKGGATNYKGQESPSSEKKTGLFGSIKRKLVA